jgi:hypothetical protein
LGELLARVLALVVLTNAKYRGRVHGYPDERG